MKEVRLVRDQTVEIEVLVRQANEECDRSYQNILKDEVNHKTKLDQFTLSKKSQIAVQKKFQADCLVQEKELKSKLSAIQEELKDVMKE